MTLTPSSGNVVVPGANIGGSGAFKSTLNIIQATTSSTTFFLSPVFPMSATVAATNVSNLEFLLPFIPLTTVSGVNSVIFTGGVFSGQGRLAAQFGNLVSFSTAKLSGTGSVTGTLNAKTITQPLGTFFLRPEFPMTLGISGGVVVTFTATFVGGNGSFKASSFNTFVIYKALPSFAVHGTGQVTTSLRIQDPTVVLFPNVSFGANGKIAGDLVALSPLPVALPGPVIRSDGALISSMNVEQATKVIFAPTSFGGFGKFAASPLVNIPIPHATFSSFGVTKLSGDLRQFENKLLGASYVGSGHFTVAFILTTRRHPTRTINLESNVDLPLSQNFSVWAGTTEILYVTVLDGQMNPVDLTDATIVWNVSYDSQGDGGILITKTGNVIDPTVGIFAITIQPKDTIVLAAQRTYFHTAKSIDLFGNVTDLMTGIMVVTKALL